MYQIEFSDLVSGLKSNGRRSFSRIWKKLERKNSVKNNRKQPNPNPFNWHFILFPIHSFEAPVNMYYLLFSLRKSSSFSLHLLYSSFQTFIFFFHFFTCFVIYLSFHIFSTLPLFSSFVCFFVSSFFISFSTRSSFVSWMLHLVEPAVYPHASFTPKGEMERLHRNERNITSLILQKIFKKASFLTHFHFWVQKLLLVWNPATNIGRRWIRNEEGSSHCQSQYFHILS